MREAARLQSFDDDFRFITSDDEKCDTTRIGVGMDMIGEAVPPILAQSLAIHLANQLDRNGDQNPTHTEQVEIQTSID